MKLIIGHLTTEERKCLKQEIKELIKDTIYSSNEQKANEVLDQFTVILPNDNITIHYEIEVTGQVLINVVERLHRKEEEG